MGEDTTSRVLRYLERAEHHEPEVEARDSYRLAWLLLLYSSRGLPEPFVQAHYRVFGIHPGKLQAELEARRRSQLGPLYDLVMGHALPPKKPSVSVRALRGVALLKEPAAVR